MYPKRIRNVSKTYTYPESRIQLYPNVSKCIQNQQNVSKRIQHICVSKNKHMFTPKRANRIQAYPKQGNVFKIYKPIPNNRIQTKT